jgi:uncharacterized LabA/DUF88 family protein
VSEEKKKPDSKKKRAIVFFDGNNFYHSLKQNYLRPSNIDMGKVSELVCGHYDCEYIRSIYYNSVPSIEDGKDIYYNHMKFLSVVGKYPKFEVKTRKLQRISNKEAIKLISDELDKLGLCKICRPLVETHWKEYIGAVSIKEKGVDNLISLEAVRLSIIEKECDACIIITGDADFVPTLDLLKQCRIWGATACPVRGYSYALRQHYPWYILDAELLKKQCSKK